MKRLAIRFAFVLGVLFLTFPVRNAYSFANGWDPTSVASRFLSFITYLFYSGISLKGGLAWYAGLAGIVTGLFLVGDAFLTRVTLEAGSVFEANKWKSGGTKPLALLTLLLAGAGFVWALTAGGLVYLDSAGEIALQPASKLLPDRNILESAGWGALMLFSAWPLGNLITRKWCK
jgi:hypothetical protein